MKQDTARYPLCRALGAMYAPISQPRPSLTADDVTRILGELSPYEAVVAGALYGLWGRPRKSPDDLAATLGATKEAVLGHDRAIRAKAAANSTQERLPFDDRYNSIIPFLIMKSAEFVKRRLTPRQNANYSLEDVMLDIWVELAEKDDKWSPERGKYITFAGKLVANLFSSIDDNSRTVHAPRNSGSRLSKYEADEETGTITSRRKLTSHRVRSSRGEIDDLSDAGSSHAVPTASDDAEAAEQRRIMVDAIGRGLAALSPYEAVVAGWTYGLWGKPQRSVDEIADSLHCPREKVREYDRSLRCKIRELLVESGHAAAEE